MLKAAIFVLLATTHGQQHFSDRELWISEDFRFLAHVGTGRQARTRTTSNTVKPGLASDSRKERCTTENGLMGECMSISFCFYINRNMMPGDIRIYDYRKPCPSSLDICCPLPNNLPPTASDEKHHGCGWRNPDGVGSNNTEEVKNEAKFGEFPWMVAILELEPIIIKENGGQKMNIYVQGGSLIHPSVVLTAARQLTYQSKLRVRVGEWDTQTNSEIYPHQDKDVKEIVIHENFNTDYWAHRDVALLFLSESVDMSQPNIGLACLPPQGDTALTGTRCLVSGWGKDKLGIEGRYQVILKKIEMPVISRTFCQSQMRKTSLGADFQLHSNLMCAGGESGKNICVGDGGSPLVCPIEYTENRYVQNGIVAWGVGCGEGVFSVYVDVAVLRDWIDGEVSRHGYDTKSYTF